MAQATDEKTRSYSPSQGQGENAWDTLAKTHPFINSFKDYGQWSSWARENNVKSTIWFDRFRARPTPVPQGIYNAFPDARALDPTLPAPSQTPSPLPPSQPPIPPAGYPGNRSASLHTINRQRQMQPPAGAQGTSRNTPPPPNMSPLRGTVQDSLGKPLTDGTLFLVQNGRTMQYSFQQLRNGSILLPPGRYQINPQ